MPLNPDEPWLLPMLKAFQPRVGMYIGSEDVVQLAQFLQGYRHGRVDLGLSPDGVGEPDHIYDFGDWLRKNAGSARSGPGWAAIIVEMDGSNRNVKTFYREFERYLAERSIDFQATAPFLSSSWHWNPHERPHDRMRQ